MSDILRWLYDDEQVDSTPILSVKPKPIPPGETINEDILVDEIKPDIYCPTCNKLVPGFPCSDTECPW